MFELKVEKHVATPFGHSTGAQFVRFINKPEALEYANRFNCDLEFTRVMKATEGAGTLRKEVQEHIRRFIQTKSNGLPASSLFYGRSKRYHVW